MATSSLGATDAVCRMRSHQSRPGPRAPRLVGPEGAERKWSYLVRVAGELETKPWGRKERSLMASKPRSDSDPLGTLAGRCPSLGLTFSSTQWEVVIDNSGWPGGSSTWFHLLLCPQCLESWPTWRRTQYSPGEWKVWDSGRGNRYSYHYCFLLISFHFFTVFRTPRQVRSCQDFREKIFQHQGQRLVPPPPSPPSPQPPARHPPAKALSLELKRE